MKNLFWYGVVFVGGLFVGTQYISPILPQLNHTVTAISDGASSVKSSLPKVK